ncbi:hypothetical protein ACFQ8E_01765 [Isoptericola sp. NPDC056573]|uniref:hypothetical protein n=1 Tax=Isoptericola sp. NPDC056573 TaxID=3345868 RepID=UPI0036981D95
MSRHANEVDESTAAVLRRDRLRRAVASAVATALVLAVSLVLVPGLASEGAPKFNVQCDELIDGISEAADPVDLPGGGLPSGHAETIADYEYENPAEHLSGEKEPTKAELKKLKGSYKTFPVGSRDRMIRRWNVYKGTWGWDQWRNSYIPNQANDARGDAFHGNVGRRLKLGGPSWMCEDTKLAKEQKLGSNRRYDSVNRTLKIAYEVKSGNSSLRASQLKADAALRAKGWRVVYIFSKEPTPKQLEQMRTHKVEHTTLRSTAVQKNPSPSSSTAMNPTCGPAPKSAGPSTLSATCPRRATAGPAKDLAQRSGRTPALAREGQRMQASFGADGRRQGFMPRSPGGIDWRSLELRYVTDDPKAGDYGYAFSADELPDDGVAEPGYGGEAALDLSSDALMTWLALDPEQFWVNLNPDTPDTIVDEEFGSTDAGRVLLEADLEMKQSLNDLMRPETEQGKKHWESLERTDDGLICSDWTRLWIDPQPAKVRVEDDQLYILDAPLQVQIEPFDVDWEVPGNEVCQDAPPKMVERNTQRIVDDFEQPLEDYVNSAPEYADLRRVYTARVAAEWIKDRDAERPGAFHDVIGSGDVSAWPARTEYDPKDVYDEYRELLKTVQYRYEYEHGEQEFYIEIFGGIVLPDAPRDLTPKAEFERDHPKLPRTVRSARFEATSLPVGVQAPQGDEVGTLDDATTTAWLGGGTLAEPEEPEPTDPPDEPDPTDPPGDGGSDGGNGGGNGGGGGGGGGGGSGDSGDGSDDAVPPDASDGPAGRGDERPGAPHADAPPSSQAPLPGALASTGFGDAGLMVAAIVLVLVGLVLVGVRRRWFPRL